MDTVFIQAAKTSEFQWGFQLIGAALGLIVIGVLIPIAIWLIKKGIDRSQNNKEEISIIEKLTETHVLVKDTREDVREMKVDMSDIKKTQKDHEKRLTSIEKEHNLYSKAFCKPNKEKDSTKEMRYIRALVVDDQKEVIQYMDDFFHEDLMKKSYWKKYIFQIDGVNDFDEGTEKLSSNNYNLALIDYKLNDQDFRNGFHFAQQCQKKGLECFIIYSADDNLKKIPKEYASRFIVKPGTPEGRKAFEKKLKEMI